VRKLLNSFSIVLLAALVVPVAFAQNSTDKPPSASPDQDVSYIRLSADLAAVARATRDPVLMLSAAILNEMAVTQDTTREKATRSEGDAEVGEKPEAESLFALAEEYAGSNEELLAVIEQSRAMVATMKGRVGGPGSTISRVRARDTDIYRVRFRGREFAEVCVVGDGDTDLDLFIYDENGNVICSDTGYTDRAYCSWTPRWTGTFDIEIENLGSVWNEYRLVTN